jgi:DNA polymerase-3 subunit epsilon
VTGIECATPLEARVRELRLIAAHKPKYNRRSRHPEKMHWLKLTVEPWPRLSLVRKVADDDADYL